MPDLQSVVSDEVEVVVDFVALLRQEQAALQQGAADSLGTIAQQKSVLIERLNSLARERNARLAEAGLEADKAGMTAWLARHPHDNRTRADWERLLRNATEAHALHQQNGALIALRLQATNEALAVLQQQAQRTALYGPNGQASAVSGYRIIDSA